MSNGSGRTVLTTSEVGGLLEVHPSTVKRWCDEGTLSYHRTPGGHRRIHLNDALAAAREAGLETFLDPFHPWESNVWTAWSQAEKEKSFQRLHHLGLGWLSRGQTDHLGRLLFEIGRRPSVPFAAFLDNAIRGFMVKVGEEWQAGRLGIGEEHMATQVITEVLIRLRKGWDSLGLSYPSLDRTTPVAIVGAVAGDHHDLGALGIRVLLERSGWRVYYLGSNVPVEEFAQIQRAYGASLVCLSLSPSHTLPDLQRIVRVMSEFYRPEHPYALAAGGGPASSPATEVPRGPFEDQLLSSSAQDFQDWIQTRFREGGRPDPRRVA